MQREQRRRIEQNRREDLRDVREQSPRFLGVYVCWAFMEAVATTVMLIMYWGRPCDEPLRWFLLVFALRFVLSVPLTVHRFRALRGGEEAEFAKYLLSWLDVACFVWFFAGNVWLFGSETCKATNAPLYYYTLVVVCVIWLSVCLPLVVIVAMFACFPIVMIALQLLAEPEGAPEDVINDLPSRTFDSASEPREDGDEPPSCCICMNAYQDGEMLRELHCKHSFHATCVDHWLKIKRECPLCRRDITTAPEDIV